MPLFFFISGFLLSYTRYKKREKYFTFIKNKAIKLLIPYIFFTVVGFGPKILLSDYVNDDVDFSMGYFLKTILVPQENVWGHLWFLPVLFIFYVFSYVFLYISRNKIYTIIFTLTAIFLLLYPLKTGFIGIYDICRFLFYFWLGILLNDFILKNKNKLLKPLLGFILFVISIVMFFFFYFHFRQFYKYAQILIALLMIWSIFCFAAGIEKSKKIKTVFNYFNGKTFSMFLLSWPAQAIVEVVFNRWLNVEWFVTIALMFLVGLGVPLIIIFIINKLKITNRWVHIFFGI